MTDRRYDLHDKIAERDADKKPDCVSADWKTVATEFGFPSEEIAARHGHDVLRHVSAMAEEIAALRNEIGKHYDVPRIEHLNDQLEKERAYSAKLRQRFAAHLDALEAINAHLGYKFTQPLIKARQAIDLKPPGG